MTNINYYDRMNTDHVVIPETDDITGLMNTYGLFHTLAHHLYMQGENADFSLIRIYIPEFTKMLQYYGNDIEAPFLRDVAKVFIELFHENIGIARFAGASFLIAVGITNERTLEQYTIQLKRSFAKLPLVLSSDLHITLQTDILRMDGVHDFTSFFFRLMQGELQAGMHRKALQIQHETPLDQVERMWKMYENMPELAVVVDMDSYDIVYMNQKARELFNVRSDREMREMKCYELLDGSRCPCEVCNLQQLKEGEWLKKTDFHHILRRYYRKEATLVQYHGRRYRFELSFDITEEMETEQTTKASLAYVNSLSNEALRIALSEADPEKSIRRLLEYLGKALRGDRTYIFENKGAFLHNTYEWCAYQVSPEIDFLQNIPIEAGDLWFREFEKRSYILIEDIEDVRETTPEIYAYLKPQNITSLVVVPLYHNQVVSGFYGIDNPPLHKLAQVLPSVLKTIGHFIDSIIERRDLVQELAALGMRDQMTRMGNRHAMEYFFENVDRSRSIGFVYCDVCGLKQMNDTLGHHAGDQLLLRSSAILKEVFAGYELFRMGGDEFLVLASGITEKELLDKEEQLRIISRERNAPIAIGVVWSESIPEDAEPLLIEADKRMYADKQEYYKNLIRK